MKAKRKRRVGSSFEDRPTKKTKSENLSTCGCGLTDRNKTRHLRHARHQTWAGSPVATNPSAALAHIPQAGDQAMSLEWGACILASETITGWNVFYPGCGTPFFASLLDLGL
jgi:hypothetical protein